MQTETNGRITAQDLYRLERISGCEISPDGKHVAYAVERVDQEMEEEVLQLVDRTNKQWSAPAVHQRRPTRHQSSMVA